MKTTFLKLPILAAILLAGLLLPGKILAQSNPYTVTNNLACAVKINIQIQKQGSCVVCQAASGIIIPPGGNFNINITPCLPTPVCDITVTVTQVAGNLVSPPVTDSSSSVGGATGSGGSCAPSFTLDVFQSGTYIN
jgi:hypothetical protein